MHECAGKTRRVLARARTGALRAPRGASVDVEVRAAWAVDPLLQRFCLVSALVWLVCASQASLPRFCTELELRRRALRKPARATLHGADHCGQAQRSQPESQYQQEEDGDRMCQLEPRSRSPIVLGKWGGGSSRPTRSARRAGSGPPFAPDLRALGVARNSSGSAAHSRTPPRLPQNRPRQHATRESLRGLVARERLASWTNPSGVRRTRWLHGASS